MSAIELRLSRFLKLASPLLFIYTILPSFVYDLTNTTPGLELVYVNSLSELADSKKGGMFCSLVVYPWLELGGLMLAFL